ncbi:MAG: hypothetical protein IPG71_05160 [bacterium]|nr:hypothetical protein [bacterium]
MNRNVKTALWLMLVVLLPLSGRAEVERNALRNGIVRYASDHFGALANSPLESGILYDLVAPLSGIERFDGGLAAEPTTFAAWAQVAHELRRASLASSALPDRSVLRALRQEAQRTDGHPLIFLAYDYLRVIDGVDRDKLIEMQGNKVIGLRTEWLTERRVAAMTSLHDWTYHGSSVRFDLDLREGYFSNLAPAEKVEVDFDDGAGYRDITGSAEVVVRYAATGEKTLAARLTLTSGEVLVARTRFDVRSLDAPPPSATWSLTASHSVSGPNATGEAYILYAPGHTMLERPVVLVEGLDLDNSRNWDELYDLMNQELMIESLLELGFDAVVLNYGNSTVHVQNNAFLVQELIEELNSATGGVYPLVIVGTSLGGLATRYALTYMEANSLPHNVSRFLSVDSPQNGANIPVGIQHWADFFAGESDEAAASRDALNTPAARQMLLYHFGSSGGGTANADPMFTAFQAELAGLGDYPELPRIVSISNGSSTMQNSGFLPGAQIIRWVYDSFFVDIRGNVWAVSNSANTRVLQGEINVIWPLPDSYRDVFIQPCLSWDNAPGGTTPTMLELAAVPAPYGDIEALYPSHCFIPSISALDLNVTDPFFNIAGAPNLYALTPFDSLYFPNANQEHVQITPENADWFISEIVGPLEAPQVTIAASVDSVILNWESVFGANSYRVYTSSDGAIWPLSYATTPASTWSAAAGDSISFFRVVAVRE